MNKELELKNIPMGYEVCFNNDCQLREKCLHYQAYLIQPAERVGGPAVYPTAWQDGECQRFREKKLIEKAWGFTKLYDNVPSWQKAEARHCVRSYFSGGNGPYYRVHHGENMLSPRQQEEILQIVGQFGSLEGIGFDHYVNDFDFT